MSQALSTCDIFFLYLTRQGYALYIRKSTIFRHKSPDFLISGNLFYLTPSLPTRYRNTAATAQGKVPYEMQVLPLHRKRIVFTA